MLYTLLEEDLIQLLEKKCRELGLPCMSVLGPVLRLFQSYLGAETIHRAGGTFLTQNISSALMPSTTRCCTTTANTLKALRKPMLSWWVSRVHQNASLDLSCQSRGEDRHSAAGPWRDGGACRENLLTTACGRAVCDPERIVQIRENRLLGLKAHRDDDQYIDRTAVAEEVSFAPAVCQAQLAHNRCDKTLDRGDSRGGDAALE